MYNYVGRWRPQLHVTLVSVSSIMNPVVQKADNAGLSQDKSLLRVESTLSSFGFPKTYPLDSDLPSG